MSFKAITLRTQSGRFMEIISDVGVSKPIADPQSRESQTTYWTKCLWDTGASHSAISRETAEILGLEPIGEITVLSHQGEALTYFYMVSITLPHLLHIPKVRVTECATNDVFGVVVGMDIISRGDFAITNVNGVSTFSFCVPGMETIDYIARIQAAGQ